MKIHEYQAKDIFSQFKVPIPRGILAEDLEQARQAAEQLGFPVVVKAQIHAGGRGKGGGVRLARDMRELEKCAGEILGMTLITPQTGPQGKVVRKVLIEEGLDIDQELYLSLLLDRSTSRIVVMASPAGGMDIEEVAEQTPEKIIKAYVDPALGLKGFHCRKLIFGLHLAPELRKTFSALLSSLYQIFVQKDCSLVEINPLVITRDGQFKALDAKINFDDNALPRHREIQALRDLDEEDPLEVEASKYGLNYIRMEGNVGNMVNGAGLAMATMDIIKQAGAEPANFLDVGGGASAEMVENGFRIILTDKKVKAILINIFGGILRCDVLAQGVVQAAQKVGIQVPVVVRMEGTNVEKGREILASSGLDLHTAQDLQEAARLVAQIAK